MRALILAGGTPPPEWILLSLADDAEVIISADCASYIRKAGISPDYIVGDMDSASPNDLAFFKKLGSDIHLYPREKDDTDTLIALKLALKLGANDIAIAAGTGNRFDHTYANAMLLLYANEHGADARLIGAAEEVYLARGEHIVKGKSGDTLSILPFMGAAVVRRVSGLKYGIEGFELSQMVPMGVSNELEDGEARFTVEGMALVIHSL